MVVGDAHSSSNIFHGEFDNLLVNNAQFKSLGPATPGPDSAEYKARMDRYYSIQQQVLKPTGIVRPTSVQQVSLVMKAARAQNMPFAVASGGHMAWAGSSNIEGGFVLDMGGLDQIDISEEDQTALLGPGSTWQQVYDKMAPFGTVVPCGRINSVGVAGLLLGGGITFSSAARGFAANNVYNYEVILADGSIVNANKDNHSDLFWALRLAGSNFGIVTRFDMHTYKSPAIWGAVRVYAASEPAVSDLCKHFDDYGHDNDHPDQFEALVFGRKDGADIIVDVQVNTNGNPQKPLTTAPSIHHVELVGTTHDVVNEVIALALESEARAHWYCITTHVNGQFYKDLNRKGHEIFDPLDSRKGLTWMVGSQSFKKSFIEATKGSPVFNALKRSGEDLVCVLIMTTWESASDDEELEAATNALGHWAREEARRRKILDDFVYLNYANGEQSVYDGSLIPEDVERLRKIREKYDPDGVFQRLWKGGFKLDRGPDS